MKCCVYGCQNESRSISKSQGITFHTFPSDPSIRTAWLQVLNTSDDQTQGSVVCSEHFLEDDLYETSRGSRTVKPGAIPCLEIPMSDVCSSEELKVCRICLLSESSFYSLQTENLKQAYENLTGIQVTQDDSIPNYLCPECATRVLQNDRFRIKALKANSIMIDLLRNSKELTINLIKGVNRNKEKLTSKLNCFLQCNLQIDQVDSTPSRKYKSTKLANLKDSCDKKDEEKYNIQGDADLFTDVESNVNDDGDNHNDIPNPDDDDVKHDDDVMNRRNDDGSSSDELTDWTSKLKVKLEIVKRKFQKLEPPKPKVDRRTCKKITKLRDDTFTTTFLTVEEAIDNVHKRKESSNYKNGTFKCQECFKGYLDPDAYSNHMAKHSNQRGDFQCEICKIFFKMKSLVSKHISTSHSRQYSCKKCTFVTDNRNTAQQHARWHSGHRYLCAHCPEVFEKMSSYLGHLRIKHPSNFVCELCGYSFLGTKGLKVHKNLTHKLDNLTVPDDGPLCQQCNIRFASTAAYETHISVSLKHNSDGDGSSRVVNTKPFHSSSNRAAVGPLPCEQCGVELKSSREYHHHFRRFHRGQTRTNYPSMRTPAMCELCGKIFQSALRLEDHRWMHTGEKPFKCELCDKTFSTQQYLSMHRRIHNPQRTSHPCHVCGKLFSTHSSRNKHMNIHTGQKPCKCEICDKTFQFESEMRLHITQTHLKKPWNKGNTRTNNKTVTLNVVGNNQSKMDTEE